MWIALFAVAVFCCAPTTFGLDGHQAKCVISEGNGIKVDTCDATKFLTCQSGRCMCNDIGNQLYDYRLEPLEPSNKSRTKRGTKKKIAAGIAAGAAAGAVGYVAGKSVVNGISKKNDKQKLTKVYSCYGRVGSPCVMDFNNVNIITLGTTTTTAAPVTISGNETVSVSTSTTVSTSSSSSSSQVVDLSKIPKCVKNAVCTRPNKPTASVGVDSHIVKTESDPRVGVCMCENGYKASSTDKCEKSASSKLDIGFLTTLISILLSIGFLHKSITI